MAAAPFADAFPGHHEPNELARLVAQRRAAGRQVIALGESNPAAVYRRAACYRERCSQGEWRAWPPRWMNLAEGSRITHMNHIH